jgi:hypothetical protein
MIAWMLRELFQNDRGLSYLDLSGALRGRIAQESGFRERANSPAEIGSGIEPRRFSR